MKNPISTLFFLVVLTLIGVQVHFDLAERAYVRQIAANQLILVGAANSHDAALREMISFVHTEMPAQVTDYLNKNTKK